MSHIKVPVVTVAGWCEKKLSAIDTKRKKIKEDWIKELQKPKTLFGFTLKPISEEEALKIFEYETENSIRAWGNANIHFHQYDKVKSIQKLCAAAKAAGVQEMTLSEEDVEYIF